MQKKSVRLSVCPVQFGSVKPESGSNISLGVQSKPKTHQILTLVDCVLK